MWHFQFYGMHKIFHVCVCFHASFFLNVSIFLFLKKIWHRLRKEEPSHAVLKNWWNSTLGLQNVSSEMNVEVKKLAKASNKEVNVKLVCKLNTEFGFYNISPRSNV